MKNLYELSTEEKKKYYEEFENTPYMQAYMKIDRIMGDLFIFLLVVYALGTAVILAYYPNEIGEWVYYAIIFIVYVVGAIANFIVRNTAFKRWLRIKHKIEF